MWSKRHSEINTIYIILTEKNYLSWEQNFLEEEFLAQEDEEVQYGYEEESPAKKMGLGIVWSRNTNFDGVGNQPSFYDHFCPRCTISFFWSGLQGPKAY